MTIAKSSLVRMELSADQTVTLSTSFFYDTPKICYAVGYHKFVSFDLDGTSLLVLFFYV
jgi:hypothetical protein